MASYSLALQLRAAERTVKAELPKRSMAARILLACDTVSAVLVIQIGQFSHPVAWLQVLKALKFYLTRQNWADERTQTRSLDPRAILASLIAPVRYSAFGLVKGQKSAAKTAVAMVGVRLVCCVLLLAILASGNCGNDGRHWVCSCREGQNNVNNGWGKYQGQWRCPGPIALHLSNFDLESEVWHGVTGPIFQAGPICDVLEEEMFPVATENSYWERKLLAPVLNCSSVNGLMPPMLEASCQQKEIDIVRFWQCHISWPSWFSGICNSRFTLCAALGGEIRLKKILILSYILMPAAAFMLSILTHGAGRFMQPPLMGVNEDKVLRKKIKRQAADLQDQLESGNLQESLLCSSPQYDDRGNIKSEIRACC
eukprot:Skav210476  [mRNA]  locus=scaffold737:585740:587845:- [translate_table: standard]